MHERTPSLLPREPYFCKMIEHTRELLQKSFELLQQPMPDTFLGRKTQEPFPWQDDA
ncbi:hypothetical protein [Bradyrhizobium neotropicale]|uniref:hypothetical protein n=1 Tax=Bradyrhizobium neotropicale TaxID=1497615 RepID=UPI001AD6DF62|nr:hypothetical protein [Bradyrhizobium neotropicale]MBO4226659.1 hypothetical protein [Bradyrhizobium neotropicale]